MSQDYGTIVKYTVIGGVALGAVYLLYKAGDFASTALNPASDKNLAYTGVNSVVQTLTGDKDATLGTKLYDWLHPNEGKLISATRPETQQSGSWYDSVLSVFRSDSYKGK